MSKIPFVSRAMERSARDSFSIEIADLLRSKRDEILDPANNLQFQHGTHWEAPANEMGDRSGQMEGHSFEVFLSLREVLAGNPAVIFDKAELVANGMINSFERMIFQKLNETTERTGNVIDAKKCGSLTEAFAQLLEKIEIPVDSQGSLQLPTIALTPELAKKLISEFNIAGPEFENRIEEIKARKLEQALERERQRVARFERRTK